MTRMDIIASLVSVMETAINREDWKVDGACDPDLALRLSRMELIENGYHKIDGEWSHD